MPGTRDISPAVARLRGRVGLLTAAGAPAEQVQAARAELATALREDHIRRLIEKAPPLTPEQRECIAALLAGPGEP
jgi:Spy/CpxP family protein refolding chaperone